MALLTHLMSFLSAPFCESTVCDDLNRFLATHGIVNVEKRLIEGERGTGWLFLAELEIMPALISALKPEGPAP